MTTGILPLDFVCEDELLPIPLSLGRYLQGPLSDGLGQGIEGDLDLLRQHLAGQGDVEGLRLLGQVEAGILATGKASTIAAAVAAPLPAKADLRSLVGDVIRWYAESGGLLVVAAYGQLGPIEVDGLIAAASLRVLCMGLQNILRHTASRQAILLADANAGSLNMELIDQGQGFDLDQAKQEHAQGGLAQMAALANLVNGNLQIYTKPGLNTKVSLTVPLLAVVVTHEQAQLAKPAHQEGHAQKPKVLLANDSILFLQSLASSLPTAEYRVAGLSTNPRQLQRTAKETKPDILVTDTTLAGVDTFSLVQLLLAKMPNLQVVYLTNSNDPLRIQYAVEVGAKAYLDDNISISELLAALKALPQTPFQKSPSFGNNYVLGQSQSLHGAKKLSPTQVQIYRLSLQRMTNKEIAKHLDMTESNVKYHMRHILTVLSIAKKGELRA